MHTEPLALIDPLLERIWSAQRRYAEQQSREVQRDQGQYFTPPGVARLMVSMLGGLGERVRVLDPGAGAGMLAAAVCERIAMLREPRAVEVHAYETDPGVIPLLRESLGQAGDLLAARGHHLRAVVHERDFILDGPGTVGACLFDEGAFDVAVLNPPYLKIGKDSRYAAAMHEIVKGQPNLYALFMALSAQCLRRGGQFVSITPRSFCAGPYFRSFRCWFFSRIAAERFHLFGSRREAFSESDVLQENVITFGRAGASPRSRITLTHSTGPGAALDAELSLNSASVIRGEDRIVRLPTSEAEVGVMRVVDAWPRRFEEVGLRVSTGPIVLFRSTEFVRRGFGGDGHVPLLTVHNVRPFEVKWPGTNTAKVLSFEVGERSLKLLIPASNYVVLRRFSAKEEDRRLVASPLLAGAFGARWFALENHLNYIYHADRALTEDEAVGVAALLNSRLLDTYFRTMSGNTQVNAAELRAMPFPDLACVAEIGRRLRRRGGVDVLAGERAVEDTLARNGTPTDRQGRAGVTGEDDPRVARV